MSFASVFSEPLKAPNVFCISIFRTSAPLKSEVMSRHCAVAFSVQVLKSCTDLDPTLLYVWILEKYSRFERENKMLALGVYFSQPCSRAGRRFAVSRSRLNYYQTIGSFAQNACRSLRCWFSIMLNRLGNLSMRGTLRLLLPPDIRGLLPTPKETYDLNKNLSTVLWWSIKDTASIGSFCNPKARPDF